jgi:hypothetical protein
MKPFPETKEEMKTILRDLMAKDSLWHIDDDPDQIFGIEDGSWRRSLVVQMNALWADDVREDQKHLWNVAAWLAFEECCPEAFDPESGFWMRQDGDL